MSGILETYRDRRHDHLKAVVFMTIFAGVITAMLRVAADLDWWQALGFGLISALVLRLFTRLLVEIRDLLGIIAERQQRACELLEHLEMTQAAEEME